MYAPPSICKALLARMQKARTPVRGYTRTRDGKLQRVREHDREVPGGTFNIDDWLETQGEPRSPEAVAETAQEAQLAREERAVGPDPWDAGDAADTIGGDADLASAYEEGRLDREELVVRLQDYLDSNPNLYNLTERAWLRAVAAIAESGTGGEHPGVQEGAREIMSWPENERLGIAEETLDDHRLAADADAEARYSF